jgi:hypothetical protein
VSTTTQRLAEYAKILNHYGPDTPQSEQFIRENESDPEFVKLARLSEGLKRALMPQPIPARKPATNGPKCGNGV